MRSEITPRSLAEKLSRIVAEDLRRLEGDCVGCRAWMLRPVRRHGDLPLWFCPNCRAKAAARREVVSDAPRSA